MFKTNATGATVDNHYQNKDVGGGIAGTEIDAVDGNITQDELTNAVESAGIVLDPTGVTRNQISQALAVYGGGGAEEYVDTGASVADDYVIELKASFVNTPLYYAGLTVSFDVPTPNLTTSPVLRILPMGSIWIGLDTGASVAIGQLTGRVTCKFDGAFWRLQTNQLADLEVTTAKLDTQAVTIDKMAIDSVWRFQLATDAVLTRHITNGQVTIDKMDTDSVGAAQIIDGSVGVAEIGNNAVGGSELIDGNVWYQKLSTSASEAFNVADRVAKAWAHYSQDATTGDITVLDSFNIDSIVEDVSGVGLAAVNFIRDMANTSYTVSPGGNNTLTSRDDRTNSINWYNKATTGFTISTWREGVGGDAFNSVTFNVFGERS